MTSTHQCKCFSFLSLPCNLICSLSLSSAKEEKKKKENINEISDPILLEQYTAIADYKKQKNTECSLSAGQVVEVIDKNENGKAFLIQLPPQPSLSLSLLPFLHSLFLCSLSGWWFVHMDDLNEGWVPATYLEPIYGQNEANKVIREERN